MKKTGYDVFPVNPFAEQIDGDKCFANLESIPGKVVGIVIGTKPEAAKQIVEECGKLGIKNVWIHQSFGNGNFDKGAVEKAVEGQDVILCALGHKKWFRPTSILSDGTRNIISAMEKNNVRRFIRETSLSVGDSFGRMGLYYTLFTIPIILQFYFWDKFLQEKIIKSSSLDWTIIQPGALNNRKAKGKWKEGNKVGNYLWTVGISRADVADFMLKQITDSKYVQKTVGISW